MARHTSKFKDLPASVQKVIQHAISQLAPEKIILFGSRSRQSHREDSDFDLAFILPPSSKNLWKKFVVEVDEAPWTLYKIDLVDIESLTDEYKKIFSARAL